MLQVSTIQACFVQASFTSVSEPTSGSKGPVTAFADFLSGLINPDSSDSKATCCGTDATGGAKKAADPGISTFSLAIQSLTESLASLVGFVEKRIDQLREQLNVALPGELELKQASSVSRIEITGVFGKQKQFEEALNDDMFFCESFKSVRIRYAELRSFDVNPAPQSEAFSLTLKEGKAAFNPAGLNEDLFSRLIEELDRIREKEKEDASTTDPELTA